MQLVPTTEKIQIKWFVINGTEKSRYSGGIGFRAWDATCSCGWESKTGGAIRASVLVDVNLHKTMEHGYSYQNSYKYEDYTKAGA
jgi:hypothetical protein